MKADIVDKQQPIRQNFPQVQVQNIDKQKQFVKKFHWAELGEVQQIPRSTLDKRIFSKPSGPKGKHTGRLFELAENKQRGGQHKLKT